MTTYRVSWKPGNAQHGSWHEVTVDTAAEAAWYVATTVALPSDGTMGPPVLVDCAELDPQSGKPVRPEMTSVQQERE